MKKDEIEIRSLQRIEDLNKVRKLEGEIWGSEDSIPTHQTITAVKNGGLVLGAYLDGQLVGFQYSFAGFNGKMPYLCSHILGTAPKFRNKKIGEKLKWAQRAEALQLGYSLITWTYDPLESINGYLNIAKLGSVCSTYIPNCYGEMEDLLNSGLPSDRFLVEWHIEKEKSATLKDADFSLDTMLHNSLIQWQRNEKDLPVPSGILPLPQHDIAFVAVPKDFRNIREINMEAAMDWRMKSREVFVNLFEQGWQVTGFHKNSIAELPVQFYILSKKNERLLKERCVHGEN
ncbi:GNAT family N-acetyltransferase [Bacillus sp. V5-8f]|uniref:GNAT family N-acetyltransferase n=1 Tax=Bacillus sp. V5-8f TaxID=2053044 RepID=UPI000C77A1FC|nr:GNAT family N-acetyltransferase [Bacillus sp. V5-8f]PLT33389.1 GNAT family N-acetyltransferase [Bacillus sp. V5-8f]